MKDARDGDGGSPREPSFDELLARIRASVGNTSRETALKRVCSILHESVAHYDWVGFYLVEPAGARELSLGPFVGAPTEHVRIPFGTGVCGRAAEERATIVVQDVTQETNYLSCSVNVKSEIVMPLMKGTLLLGELDIDSHTTAAFTEADREFLTSVCECVADLL
jgi:GAF domain-containing protein